MEYYSSADEEQDLAEWLAGRSETGDPGVGILAGGPGGADVIDLPTGEGEASA
jgi:hypothetical protein